jgi:hypothetical protein
VIILSRSIQEILPKDFQIRFSIFGLDQDFQDFLHMIYEMERKPIRDINWKPHVLQLSREMLTKTGTFLTLAYSKIGFKRRIWCTSITKNKGILLEDTLTLNYSIMYVLDEAGDAVKVPGQDQKYQFHLVKADPNCGAPEIEW